MLPLAVCGRVYITSGNVIDWLDGLVERERQRRLPELAREEKETFPTEELIALRERENGREALAMRWGVMPQWKGKGGSRPMINARAETAPEKRVWSKAFRERRCVLPVSGFYEWDQHAPKPRPRFRIHLATEAVTPIAGLWSDSREWGPCCTILTTRAGEAVAPLHHRQPVIVPNEHLERWLDPTITELEPLEDLLQPLGSEQLVVEADAPPPPDQKDLFST